MARLVLDDNRSQSLAISLDELRAKESADDFRELMVSLEKSGELDRAAEGLPSTDVLAERRERGQSLTRPELCILLAYAKLSLKTHLLRGRLPDDPITESYLLGYFPGEAIRDAGNDALEGHRLRREIIAGQVTNDLVDLMGATFVNRVARDTGRSADDVVRAWLVSARLAEHRALLYEMARQQSALDVGVSYRWLLGLARVLERTTRWVLQNVDPTASPARIVDENVSGLAELRAAFDTIVAGEERELFEARVEEIKGVGADDGFSRNLITLRFLDQLLEILQIARDTGAPETAAGTAYYTVSQALDIPWLRRTSFASAGGGQWEQRAAQALAEDLSRAHRKLTLAVLARASDGDVDAAAMSLLASGARDVERYSNVLSELRAEETAGLAGAAVAVRELAAFGERALPATRGGAT